MDGRRFESASSRDSDSWRQDRGWDPASRRLDRRRSGGRRGVKDTSQATASAREILSEPDGVASSRRPVTEAEREGVATTMVEEAARRRAAAAKRRLDWSDAVIDDD